MPNEDQILKARAALRIWRKQLEQIAPAIQEFNSDVNTLLEIRRPRFTPKPQPVVVIFRDFQAGRLEGICEQLVVRSGRWCLHLS